MIDVEAPQVPFVANNPKKQENQDELVGTAGSGSGDKGGNIRSGGTGSGSGSGGFRAGQKVNCKISHAEPGGYAVLLTDHNLAGLLPTERKLEPGQDVVAHFVCISNSRILLMYRPLSDALSEVGE